MKYYIVESVDWYHQIIEVWVNRETNADDDFTTDPLTSEEMDRLADFLVDAANNWLKENK